MTVFPRPLSVPDGSTHQTTDDMEIAYRQAVGLVCTLAKLLGKPSPVMTRAQRRALRELGLLAERNTETDP